MLQSNRRLLCRVPGSLTGLSAVIPYTGYPDVYLNGITGIYQTPKGCYVDDADAEAFDRQFPPREKLKLPGQLID